MRIARNIPSPLWGGLGWGSLRLGRKGMNFILRDHPTPTPALPTGGRGKKFSQSTEKLIRAALKELAAG